MSPMSRWEKTQAIARGLRAVAALLASAADALISAAVGLPPLAWLWRRARAELAEEYRRGYWHAVDAEIVEPGPQLSGPAKEGA
jgi:hypothetical protein